FLAQHHLAGPVVPAGAAFQPEDRGDHAFLAGSGCLLKETLRDGSVGSGDAVVDLVLEILAQGRFADADAPGDIFLRHPETAHGFDELAVSVVRLIGHHAISALRRRPASSTTVT